MNYSGYKKEQITCNAYLTFLDDESQLIEEGKQQCVLNFG